MTAFIAVKDSDKDLAIPVVTNLINLGFRIMATGGTHARLSAAGRGLRTGQQGQRGAAQLRGPHARRRRAPGGQHHRGHGVHQDSFSLRRTALMRGLPYYTTMSAARAAADAIARLKSGSISVCSLQEYQHG
jgi:carbamoyl-phosphate synthase large subunit